MFENVTAQRHSCLWVWKDRKDRWSLTSNLGLLTTSEGQPYSLSLKVGNLMFGGGECLPKCSKTQQVPSATMVCPPRKILLGGRNSYWLKGITSIKQNLEQEEQGLKGGRLMWHQKLNAATDKILPMCWNPPVCLELHCQQNCHWSILRTDWARQLSFPWWRRIRANFKSDYCQRGIHLKLLSHKHQWFPQECQTWSLLPEVSADASSFPPW